MKHGKAQNSTIVHSDYVEIILTFMVTAYDPLIAING